MSNQYPTIKQYRRKPVNVEAIQWTGLNLDDVMWFIGDEFGVSYKPAGGKLIISTLEETDCALRNDWIIKDIASGKVHPCNQIAFHALYELADKGNMDWEFE